MLTIIMGKTCSGKDSVVAELVKKKFKPIVPYTSRPIRKGEANSKQYHFVSEDEFCRLVKVGFLIEWKSLVINGKTWRYGASIDDIINASRDDKYHVLITTPQGVVDILKILKSHFSDYNVKVIYLYSNHATIFKRLKARKDKNDSIERRIASDDADFKEAVNLADKIVYNNDGENISDIANKIKGIVCQN